MFSLAGKRIFIVEDEVLVAAMLEDMLIDLGAAGVVGPASTIQKALELAATETMDAAVLDVNLRNERIDPVAEALRLRNIPMIFASGYGQGAVRVARGSPIIDKPYTMATLAAALAACLAGAGKAPDGAATGP